MARQRLIAAGTARERDIDARRGRRWIGGRLPGLAIGVATVVVSRSARGWTMWMLYADWTDSTDGHEYLLMLITGRPCTAGAWRRGWLR